MNTRKTGNFRWGLPKSSPPKLANAHPQFKIIDQSDANTAVIHFNSGIDAANPIIIDFILILPVRIGEIVQIDGFHRPI